MSHVRQEFAQHQPRDRIEQERRHDKTTGNADRPPSWDRVARPPRGGVDRACEQDRGYRVRDHQPSQHFENHSSTVSEAMMSRSADPWSSSSSSVH